jgi:hypothetical protein
MAGHLLLLLLVVAWNKKVCPGSLTRSSCHGPIFQILEPRLRWLYLSPLSLEDNSIVDYAQRAATYRKPTIVAIT